MNVSILTKLNVPIIFLGHNCYLKSIQLFNKHEKLSTECSLYLDKTERVYDLTFAKVKANFESALSVKSHTKSCN